MMLTKLEKRNLIVPVALALLLLGVGAYMWHLSDQNRALQELITKTSLRINKDRATLDSLQDFDEKERIYLEFRLDDWIPVFRNGEEVKLFLTKKVEEALASVAAKEEDWQWIPSEIPPDPSHTGAFHLQALFPSYAALVVFIESLEEGVPPLLPQAVDIHKAGIRLTCSVTLNFAYRLTDERV
ncbi:MAG: hypothetical protein JXD19_08965 [Deltaproteobacteria bacterium]|nr:hypothetical protein [Deltaproteobacteria bacterium]